MLPILSNGLLNVIASELGNQLFILGRGLPESKYGNKKNQRFTPPPNIRQDKYLDQSPKEEFNLLPGLTPFSKSWNVGNYA